MRDWMQVKADRLSGGEQQMVSIACSLSGHVRLLLLDEPFEGLSPAMADEVFAAFRILSEQPASITIANRTVEKALALGRRFARFGPVEGGDYARLAGRQFDLIVNATSASLMGELPALPPGLFAPGSLAYDMVYGDEPTRFLVHAREHGAAQLADGLGMLLAQAAESFFLWRGVRPDIRSVIETLRGR